MSHFPSVLQEVVQLEKYSRYRADIGRRETWGETVSRSVDFLRELSQNKLPDEDYRFIYRMIHEVKVMPSMRLLAMAGEAARRNPISIFNCSYMPVIDLKVFEEAMFLSMNGVGVGYSVEKHNIRLLPEVEPRKRGFRALEHTVGDTTEGWVMALRMGLRSWFTGNDVVFDYSQVRPAGAILKTKGGRASGPEPLKESLNQIREIVLKRAGSRLTSLDAHDIMCWVASASISGGVRRSALICLFSPDDEDIINCKQGPWWAENPQRAYANNSAVITNDTPDYDIETLMVQMNLNGYGEPGIFNRDAAESQKPLRRLSAKWGTNPCGEITLRPFEVCNLSSVICRAEDTLVTLIEKVRAATIIGTIQSMAQSFKGLRTEWTLNQMEERLLGVDLNGQMDCALAREPQIQALLSYAAVQFNREYARQLDINPSAAVTCVKPSGNSSQLVNASSGLHARWSPYYIRNVRLNTHSPVRQLLELYGVKMVPEVGQSVANATTWVVPFPVKSPEGAIFRNDRTAVQQLEYWAQVLKNYTEHQPSCTIYYKEGEFDEMLGWVIDHKEQIVGLSFLRSDDHKYELAPYMEINKEEYEAAAAAFPVVKFENLEVFEGEDYTTGAQELACASGVCEI